MSTDLLEKQLLCHHEQQALCTTRLPYRQGRKLTAVKVYTVNKESNHLLIFGVPALNLRQEAKALFLKFGHLHQFHISTEHPGEVFTETYHAKFDRIQSARVAKKMLDTKSFYGGSLHVSYAPEFEDIEETRRKLMLRKTDVWNRLRNLNKEKCNQNTMIETIPQETMIETIPQEIQPTHPLNKNEVNYQEIKNEVITNEDNYENKKINMGDKNIIYMNKRKAKDNNVKKKNKSDKRIEVIDFTSTNKETLSNINDALNYNKFGNEVIRAVDVKPVNIIKFNKKS